MMNLTEKSEAACGAVNLIKPEEMKGILDEITSLAG